MTSVPKLYLRAHSCTLCELKIVWAKDTVKWYRCHIAEWGGIKNDEQMSNMTNRKALSHTSPLTRER